MGLSFLGMALVLPGGNVILSAAAQSESTASEATASEATAIEQPQSHSGSEPGLRVPDDLDHAGKQDFNEHDPALTDPVSPDPVAKYTIEERRIGSRLERLTVHRNNGIDETYEVRKADSMSANEENELGEMPNVRRWTLGSW